MCWHLVAGVGVVLCGAGCCWQTAVPNVHLGVYGYADAGSCGPAMTFARSLIRAGATRKVGWVSAACRSALTAGTEPAGCLLHPG